jgi:phage tail sheath protein FI
VPVPPWAAAETDPTSQLARHVCVFAPLPDGWALRSDVTTSAVEAWRFGGASRLMSAVIRAARAAGDAVVFDANGPALWRALSRRIEDVLLGFWREGAFSGATPGQAFSVRCDRSTMTQNDIDAGRLKVEISLQPAASIERITVVLALGEGSNASALRQAA